MLNFKKKRNTKKNKGIRLLEEHIEFLENTALKESDSQGEKITLSDLVRFAIDDFIIKYKELEKNNNSVD